MRFGFRDLTGETFERWRVISRAPNRKNQTFWNCECECGTKKEVAAPLLINGGSRSCGCWRRENPNRKRHGKTKTREYKIWSGMIYRCHTKSSPHYRLYGGRGIEVCAAWRKSFETFASDMGCCPDGFTIERRDNNSGYNPSNCLWASRKAQARNTRRNHLIAHKGETKSIIAWADETGISQKVIQGRMADGWTAAEALETPINREPPRPRENRRHPRAAEKIASALLQIKRGSEWLIPEPLRSEGTAEAICQHVAWDHIVPHAIGGTMKPQNLQPLPRAEHKEKTAKIDVPRIAKGKRLERAHIAHKAVMEAKAGRAPALTRTPRKGRPMMGSKASGFKRKFSGQWERRA